MALEQLPDQYLYALLKNYGLSDTLPDNLQAQYGSLTDDDYNKMSTEMANVDFWKKYDMEATGKFVGATDNSREGMNKRLSQLTSEYRTRIDKEGNTTANLSYRNSANKKINDLKIKMGNGFMDRQGKYQDFIRDTRVDTQNTPDGKPVYHDDLLYGDKLSDYAKQTLNGNLKAAGQIRPDQPSTDAMDLAQKNFNDWSALTQADKESKGLLARQFERPGVPGSWEDVNAGYVSTISKYDHQLNELRSTLDTTKQQYNTNYKAWGNWTPDSSDRGQQMASSAGSISGLAQEQQAYFDAHPEMFNPEGFYKGPGSNGYWNDVATQQANITKTRTDYANRPQIPGSTGASGEFTLGNTFGWSQQQQQGWANNGNTNVFYGNGAIPSQEQLNSYGPKNTSSVDTSASSFYNTPYSNIGSLFNDPLNNKGNTGSFF